MDDETKIILPIIIIIRMRTTISTGLNAHNNKPTRMPRQRQQADSQSNQAQPFNEPKIKWRDSKAKNLLYDDVRKGVIPLKAKDQNGKSTMTLTTIYTMRPEYQLYDRKKLSGRLSAIRKAVGTKNDRAVDDRKLFEIYKSIHPVSYFSHKGYIEWAGSEAKELVLRALAQRTLEELGGHKEFYGSESEFYENFTLDVFRDKVRQEIRTSKYLHTLEVKGKQHKSS